MKTIFLDLAVAAGNAMSSRLEPHARSLSGFVEADVVTGRGRLGGAWSMGTASQVLI